MKKIILFYCFGILVSCNNNDLKKSVEDNDFSTPKQTKIKSNIISTDTLFYNITSGISWDEYDQSKLQASNTNKNFKYFWIKPFTNSDEKTQVIGYEIFINNNPIKFLLMSNIDHLEVNDYPSSDQDMNSLQFICLEHYDSIKKSYNSKKNIYEQILKVYESKYGKYNLKKEKIKDVAYILNGIHYADLERQTISWKNNPKILIQIEISKIESFFRVFYLSKRFQQDMITYISEKQTENNRKQTETEKEVNERKYRGVKDL